MAVGVLETGGKKYSATNARSMGMWLKSVEEEVGQERSTSPQQEHQQQQNPRGISSKWSASTATSGVTTPPIVPAMSASAARAGCIILERRW